MTSDLGAWRLLRQQRELERRLDAMEQTLRELGLVDVWKSDSSAGVSELRTMLAEVVARRTQLEAVEGILRERLGKMNKASSGGAHAG